MKYNYYLFFNFINFYKIYFKKDKEENEIKFQSVEINSTSKIKLQISRRT